jgi:Gamma tubulin complex component C-terminal
MLAFNQYNDPFSFEGLASLPAISTEPSSAWQALDLDQHHFNGVFDQLDTKRQELQELDPDYFHLQARDVPLPEIESASVSSAQSDSDDIPATNDTVKKDSLKYDEDIWALPDVTRPQISTALISWDQFLRPTHVERNATYLSELGPTAFDATLERALGQFGRHLPSKVAQLDKFVFALFELGCGRQSGLFQWDSLKRTFGRRSAEFGLLGTSQEVHYTITEGFITTGNTMKGMVDFIEENAALLESQNLVIALSSAMSGALYATMRYLEQKRHSVRSLIQLQELFHRPRLLFEGLSRLAKIVRLGSNASDAIGRLTKEAHQITDGAIWFEDILSEVVVRTAKPWLDAMADVVGLSRPLPRRAVLSDGGSALEDESRTLLNMSPHVLPLEMSHLVTECEISLQLLQTHEPSHPLLTGTEANTWPSLSWECSWEAIENLQKRANEYERSLKKAIHNFTQGLFKPDHETEAVIIDVVPPTKGHVTQHLDVTKLIDLDKTTKRNQHLGVQQGTEDDKLDCLVSTALSIDEEGSLALAPALNETLILSISPLLKAQYRLLSCSLLHLLFKRHGFRSHLRLHHQFQLLADGSFASRLSQALFDPDQSSGEGRRKGQGKTGLRLQTRDTWPPASSELRLALMGILAESFDSELSPGLQHPRPSKAHHSGLSEAISFAIRDLSDVELEKCRDADSIYALDFLCLQYKPPSALLDAVLTPASQRKYDRIFKHLLRLLRMRSVGLSLIRSVSGRNCNSKSIFDHRFRVEMQFFISTLAEYSANVAIRSAWVRLEGLVDRVETCLDCSDFDGAICVAGSLQRLTEMHDEALSSMLRALCLDRKQVQVRTLLEDIFGLILRIAAMIRRHDGVTNDYDEKVQTMYKEFRKQVSRFIRYLRAQSDVSVGNGEALVFEQLLVRLNMFGYYG